MKGKKAKYTFLVLFSFLFCMTPPTLALLSVWDVQASSPGETARISFAILSVYVVVLRSLITGAETGHLKAATFFFLGTILLESFAVELPLIAGAWLLGRVAYTVFFETALDRIRRSGDVQEGDGDR